MNNKIICFDWVNIVLSPRIEFSRFGSSEQITMIMTFIGCDDVVKTVEN